MPRSEPRRVAVLATHPIQYQAPLWRRLARREDVQLHVYFGSDLGVRGYRDEGFGVNVRWDVPLLEGYTHTFLSRDLSLQQLTFWNPRATGLRKHLRAFQPDVVLLTAYHSMFWVEALLAARSLGLPVVMRHEASDAAASRSKIKGIARDLLLRMFYSQVTRFAAIGTRAREHLLRLGIPARDIGWSPYCVDSDQLERQVVEWQPRRSELREKLGIRPGDFALIFSGKLIAKKQPGMVARAVALCPAHLRNRMHLIVMGEGELRREVERTGREVFGPRLHMTGFVNQSELGRWYAAADCLVLPSQTGAGETWGLVVNEALQFGLPSVVSDGVGCHPDLIAGDTGRVFRSGSAGELARALQEVWELAPDGTRASAEACRERVAQFSLATAETGLALALATAAEARGGPDQV